MCLQLIAARLLSFLCFGDGFGSVIILPPVSSKDRSAFVSPRTIGEPSTKRTLSHVIRVAQLPAPRLSNEWGLLLLWLMLLLLVHCRYTTCLIVEAHNVAVSDKVSGGACC